jgi:hypothetical protein
VRSCVVGALAIALAPPSPLHAQAPLHAQDATPPADACRPLLGLHRLDPASGLPASWKIREVRGAGQPTFEILPGADGGSILRITSEDDAVFAYTIREPPLLEDGGVLRWQWRTRTPIAEADLREKSEDDSPLRLFLVFAEKPISEGRLLRDGRAVFYTWGNRELRGSSFPSHVSDELAIWVLRNTEDADGAWRDEVRDPFGDYRAYFEEEPPPIRAIGLMPDTDQTEVEAIVELKGVCWGPARS